MFIVFKTIELRVLALFWEFFLYSLKIPKLTVLVGNNLDASTLTRYTSLNATKIIICNPNQ